MKCPSCGVEIVNEPKQWICPQCFAPCTGDKCPACSAMRPPEENFAGRQTTVYPDFLPKKKRRPLRVISVVLVILLIIALAANVALYFLDRYYFEDSSLSEEVDYLFGVDGNQNLAEGQKNSYYLPAKKGETLTFGAYEYDLAGNLIWCKYEITLLDTYRGDEAGSMIAEDSGTLGLQEDEELLVACFRVDMLKQHKVCDVLIHPSYFFAYETQSSTYPRVNLSASNEGKYVVREDGSLTLYVAFAVSKGSNVVLGYQNYSGAASGAYFED